MFVFVDVWFMGYLRAIEKGPRAHNRINATLRNYPPKSLSIVTVIRVLLNWRSFVAYCADNTADGTSHKLPVIAPSLWSRVLIPPCNKSRQKEYVPNAAKRASPFINLRGIVQTFSAIVKTNWRLITSYFETSVFFSTFL